MTTIIPQEVQVLLKTGSFAGNYIRAVLLILARLIFFAVLGISVSTLLSFPVAVLVCSTFFLVGTINGFVLESFDIFDGGTNVISWLVIKLLKLILWLLPRFDGQFNPTQYMISAEVLSWQFLGQVYLVMVFIKSLFLLLLGMWVFSCREIAKIVV